MKRNYTNSFPRRFAFAAGGVLLIALASGCNLSPDNSILARHLADKPRESAKERWDGVRGNVTLQLAQQHFKAGRLAECEITLEKVRALSPNSLEVNKLAAQLYIELGQLSKAQEAVAAAGRSPDGDAETDYLAGIIAERYGTLDLALAHYESASKRCPNVPEYVLATAEMFVALDQPDKAMKLLQSRVRDFDGCGAMTVLAARVARILGDTDSAVAYSREALHEDKDDEVVRADMGAILSWAGRHGEAIQVLQPLVDGFGNRDKSSRKKGHFAGKSVPPSARRVLAESYLGLEQYSEAMRVLRSLMAEDASDIHAWNLFCRAAILNKDLAAADEAIQKFNSRNAPTSETLLLEGFIALRRGRPEAAQNAAARALKLEPTLETANLLSAEALRTMGALGEAKDVCRSALNQRPNSPAVVAMLASLAMESTPSIPSVDPDEADGRAFGATAFGSVTMIDSEGDANP